MTTQSTQANQQDQSSVTWVLTPEAAQYIINVLGDLPSKTGVYPLVQDLVKQTSKQAGKQEFHPSQQG